MNVNLPANGGSYFQRIINSNGYFVVYDYMDDYKTFIPHPHFWFANYCVTNSSSRMQYVQSRIWHFNRFYQDSFAYRNLSAPTSLYAQLTWNIH